MTGKHYELRSYILIDWSGGEIRTLRTVVNTCTVISLPRNLHLGTMFPLIPYILPILRNTSTSSNQEHDDYQ